MARRIVGVRVMAEYGSSGLWGLVPGDFGLFRHAMLEPSQLQLPDDLVRRLAAWIDTYERDNPCDQLDTDMFNTEGEALARAIKHVVGTALHVELQPELPDGRPGPARAID